MVGVIDMLDLVDYAVSVGRVRKKDIINIEIEELLFLGHLFCERKLKDIISTHYILKFSKNTLLSTIIRAFAKGQHRAAVINDEGEIINVIAQSDIVSFILKNSTTFRGFLDLSLEQIVPLPFLQKNDVFKVDQDRSSAFYAFETISEKKS